ncbi:lipopolysaccharide biosynthesis protein [Micromonospora sp. LOL_024]|uniref:lipopolysaccharide biosynthesis protein n=1 Tax=Micromonospora sp. LOL_024 TaxID=3345412 RepID=UPI003A887D90
MSGRHTIRGDRPPTPDPGVKPAVSGPDGSSSIAVDESDAGQVGGHPPGSSRAWGIASWIATAVLGRVVSAIVPLALIPVTLAYLGPDLYGLWMAVIALTGMAAFADLGLGNGLLTRLAPCCASGDDHLGRRYVSSAYAMVSAIALAGCAVLWLGAGLVPWRAVFNAPDSISPADARALTLTCLTAFLLNMPLSLVNRVQFAYRMGARSNLWQAAGSASSLPLALGAVHAELPAAVVVAAAVTGPVLVNLVNTCWTFGRRLPGLAPTWGALDPATGRGLLRISGLFGVVTVLMTVADNADSLIIAHTRGLSEVTAYAVPARLFTQLGVIVMLVNQPFWPAHGEALAAGRVTWVRRTARRMTLVSTAIVLLPAAALVLWGEWLFTTWLPVPLLGDRWLLPGLAAWWLIVAATSPVFMVQNAAGVVRPQLVGYAAYLGLSLVGKWYGATHFGISAVPYVGAACYLLTVVPAALHGYRRALTAHASAPTVER